MAFLAGSVLSSNKWINKMWCYNWRTIRINVYTRSISSLENWHILISIKHNPQLVGMKIYSFSRHHMPKTPPKPAKKKLSKIKQMLQALLCEVYIFWFTLSLKFPRITDSIVLHLIKDVSIKMTQLATTYNAKCTNTFTIKSHVFRITLCCEAFTSICNKHSNWQCICIKAPTSKALQRPDYVN